MRFEERYRLGALLGTGAMATVHAGTCLQCGRAVAVKRLDTRRASARDRARLREEIDVLLAVRGAPSVCQLWDAFETPNVSLLVLELLPGGDLFEQVVRRFGGGSPSVAEDAYTEDEVRELLRTALRGLAALHEMSIVHRDIKPENLVLSEAGEVVVTDFGLAKRLATGELCSDVVGTAGYMSPEVLRREAYSYPADVWSLGVVLYVLLSGSPPFPFDDEKIEAELIKAGRWSFAGPNWGDVSDDAKQCVRFMMAPLAQVRWPPKRLLAHPWLAVPADAANGDDKNGETHDAGDDAACARARGERVERQAAFACEIDRVAARKLGPLGRARPAARRRACGAVDQPRGEAIAAGERGGVGVGGVGALARREARRAHRGAGRDSVEGFRKSHSRSHSRTGTTYSSGPPDPDARGRSCRRCRACRGCPSRRRRRSHHRVRRRRARPRR